MAPEAEWSELRGAAERNMARLRLHLSKAVSGPCPSDATGDP